MIDVGASGTQAEIPFSLYDDATGAPVTGFAFTDAGGGLTSQVKLRVPGGTYVNATIANIVEWGNGQYALQLTAGQTAGAGKVGIYVSIAGKSAQYGPEEIRASYTTALMTYSHDTGVTIKGLFIRLEAFISGKATGLKSATARFYKKDGVTKAIEAVQDTSQGTRTAGDTSGSE